jgi:hypothetical protein
MPAALKNAASAALRVAGKQARTYIGRRGPALRIVVGSGPNTYLSVRAVGSMTSYGGGGAPLHLHDRDQHPLAAPTAASVARVLVTISAGSGTCSRHRRR